MGKINYTLLPIKAHFFFFLGAWSPIWPFLNVFGKQLGVSEIVMGSITAILPILHLVAKPIFGLLADYFRNQRRALFMGLIVAGSTFYVLLYFIPQPDHLSPMLNKVDVNISSVSCEILVCEQWVRQESDMCNSANISEAVCEWFCSPSNSSIKIKTALYKHSDIEYRSRFPQFHPLCLFDNETLPYCDDRGPGSECNLTCTLQDNESKWDCLYGTPSFWGFVILMSLGSIAFNVSNSISDAICFDMLGSNEEMSYGRQRMWGTVGYGIMVFIAGWLIDWWSGVDAVIKDYTPAFCLIIILTAIDMYWCTKLKLPPIPKSQNILRDLGQLIRHRHIAIFLMFAILSGILDGFIFYYRFWFLEDLALASGNMGHIKILEGCIVAAETLVGETLFFFISGSIIQKIGFGNSLTVAFLCYAIRIGLISLATNPWWVLPIEFFVQGPTYALCYTTIVAYASAVSPPGASATMQGIVAGVDDGFGYAIGSLLGGFLYRWIGGSGAFKVLSALALLCSIVHYGLYKCYLKKKMVKVKVHDKELEYKPPDDAVDATVNGSDGRQVAEPTVTDDACT